MVRSHLESSEEVALEMARRSPSDAATWFADWLRRRDQLQADMAAEQLAEGLETLAAELRGEVRQESSARTRGLVLGAAVLFDAAGGVRVGDDLTSEDGPWTLRRSA